jgi:hypothetical protein
MWIPINLIRHRIMGKDRIEPCRCGHYHVGKEVILPLITVDNVLDVLDTCAIYDVRPSKPDLECMIDV